MELTARSATSESDRWPAETREMARELWFSECQQNASEVAARLGVPVRTIRYWMRQDGWSEQIAIEVQQNAPSLRRQILASYIVGAQRGGDYLASVAAGYEDHPDIADILTDANSDEKTKAAQIQARYRWHHEAKKARIQAALACRDGAGFSPVGKGVPALPASDQPVETDSPDFATMTPDELMAYEVRLRASRQR